ncbi:MAG: RNA polymerase sigma factor [Paraclostridium bifermentans]|uniref:RNA polymerase sigma factor n=1 Tax=Paraclostridium bifermentans TaxID=1490 RepID=UPI001DF4CD23|nr:RNA polymerase sigma factor [Paraclostridium bifermentans]MBS6506796.1 RNA polymerase sigma factor [Paraclostridium bifermentans]
MDKKTFINKVLECEQTLYNVSKSILINDSDCEDAVQDAILKAFKKLHTLKNEEYFKTWLIRILMNECYKRKSKEKINIPYEDCINDLKPDSTKDYSELYIAIRGLPKRISITVVLYYVEGYSINEIKEILKVPSGTVKSRVSRGRKLLKTTLENMEVTYE